MSKKQSRKVSEEEPPGRRRYTEEFKAEAVQMLFDGHTVGSVCERLGLSGVNLLYTWKRKLLEPGGPAAVGLEARVRLLEAELRRVERERDILKKALSIFGREYGSSMTEDLVLGALRPAIRERQPGPGLIHHTERGGQYASRRHREVLRRSGMQQSMSAAASCYDNACMESCFGTVKTELELEEYANGPAAVRELTGYIRYDNGERRLSSLGYVSPAEFAIRRAASTPESPSPIRASRSCVPAARRILPNPTLMYAGAGIRGTPGESVVLELASHGLGGSGDAVRLADFHRGDATDAREGSHGHDDRAGAGGAGGVQPVAVRTGGDCTSGGRQSPGVRTVSRNGPARRSTRSANS